MTNLSGDLPAFRTILLAPGIGLLLGLLLLYFTGVPWYLTHSPLLDIGIGLLLGTIVFVPVGWWTRLPVGASLRNTCRQLLPLFRNMAVWQMVLLSMMAGVGEELLFRGFMQTWLADYIPVIPAIVMAAVLFGLMHFASVSYFLLTTLVGCIFGITYHQTDSLLLIMSWHAGYDLVAIWVLARRPGCVGLES